MKLEIPGISGTVKPGKVLCIGRNYAAHAREMNSAVPSQPMIFLKPSTALISPPDRIVLPESSSDVHHEVELVVAIGKEGKDISNANAMQHVCAYAAGIDLTARDIQAKAKEKGHPWSVSKGFDTFAPIGPFVPASNIVDVHDLDISIKVNGIPRQTGRTSDMIFDIPTLIAYASSIFSLEAGDLIYTGTPEGVSAINSGDLLHAQITGIPDLKIQVS